MVSKWPARRNAQHEDTSKLVTLQLLQKLLLNYLSLAVLARHSGNFTHTARGRSEF